MSSTPEHQYNPAAIEPKWQAYWEAQQVFRAGNASSKPKYYVLDMFPYPSGAGLHVGHPEGYTATDIVCRYKRMKGYNVLHPMGWDAFGLPAEQYAMETGTHPAVTTGKNIANFKRQIQSLGFSYDWQRELSTTDEQYYRWTQWIFLQLHRRGLAYVDEVAVNWCPALGTVLANEEVIDGRSERGNHPVIRQPMKQWVLRITHYAERLLADLEGLDWPEGIKEQQRNWIGKSVGAEVNFPVIGHATAIKVYTTRPDTLFGATYMVLAPEHPLVAKLTTPAQQAAVSAYQQRTTGKSDLERTELAKDKTGVWTGAMATNPVTGEAIPVWIGDYVLASYGTGAIMCVPSHDERDFAFAQQFGLPIRAIIAPEAAAAQAAKVEPAAVAAGQACWPGEGTLVNSANAQGLSLNGLSVTAAKERVTQWLTAQGLGKQAINYKLRDWLFSRQRYWGEPFPVVQMEDGELRLLDESDLPVRLPPLADFRPTGTGESPLAKATEWLHYTCPKTGKQGRRETHTMPQWAGSCWYYLRFLDPHNEQAPWDKAVEKYWMPVDLYVGGAEHAVLHLLYARFWHKVLYDIGWVSTKEPFQKLVNQGMILGLACRDARGALVPMDQITERDGKYFHNATGEELSAAPAKMSKSLKNVVNPDEIIQQYGADAFRLYEMFMGPLQDTKPWNTRGVEGVYRFLHRVWRLVIGPDGQLAPEIGTHPPSREQLRVLHQTIKKVGEDIESIANFHTAISAMMICLNELSKGPRDREAIKAFLKLLAPFAPHLCEELWQRLGESTCLARESWPSYNPAYLVTDEVEIVIQIKGKPRHRLNLPTGLSAADLEARVLADEAVQKLIAGQRLVKVIAVPNRLVNLVLA